MIDILNLIYLIHVTVRDPKHVNTYRINWGIGTKDGDSREKTDEVHAVKSGREDHLSNKLSINNSYP